MSRGSVGWVRKAPKRSEVPEVPEEKPVMSVSLSKRDAAWAIGVMMVKAKLAHACMVSWSPEDMVNAVVFVPGSYSALKDDTVTQMVEAVRLELSAQGAAGIEPVAFFRSMDQSEFAGIDTSSLQWSYGMDASADMPETA